MTQTSNQATHKRLALIRSNALLFSIIIKPSAQKVGGFFMPVISIYAQKSSKSRGLDRLYSILWDLLAGYLLASLCWRVHDFLVLLIAFHCLQWTSLLPMTHLWCRWLLFGLIGYLVALIELFFGANEYVCGANEYLCFQDLPANEKTYVVRDGLARLVWWVGSI